MGLFSSLFGSASSDKADKFRQDAINAFNSIKTPELSQLQIQLDKYVQAGQISPQEAETALLSSNAFNKIATDPSYVGAQKQALQQLQNVALSGGLTPEDKARMQDITDQLEQQNRSQNAATQQQMQQRGIGGSELNAVQQQINEQGAANRAARTGTDVAAQAQARALQAMQAAGTQGGALEAQQYGEQANKAQAENAIDVFNKQALNQTNLYNTQAANAAQAANVANAQAVANANTATANANKEYNAQQVQQQYEDAMRKASGIAGINTQAANAAQDVANREYGANTGFVSGLLGAGATALGASMGGPAGAAAGSQMFKPKNPTEAGFNTQYQTGGYAKGGQIEMDKEDFKDEHTRLLNVLQHPTEQKTSQEAEKQAEEMKEHGMTPEHPDHPDHMAMGGTAHCYAYGEEVHHHPECAMAKGGKTPHFLEGLKKGALHKQLGVPSEKPIPSGKLEKATHSENETLRKRAQFAENAKHWHHHSDGGMETPDIATNDTKQEFMQGMMGSKNNEPLPIEWNQDKGQWCLKDKNGQEIGYFDSYPEAATYAEKVQQKSYGGEIDFRGGGHVPGKAKVEGDSPKNDTVDAKLSPGEVVIPRSALNDEEEFKTFMAKYDPANKKMARGGFVPTVPRVADTNPMRDVSHGSMTNPVPLAATNTANDFSKAMHTFKPKKEKLPGLPPEARALANLHQRISKLEGK